MEKMVQDCNSAKFMAYVAKLNRKAVKIGCQPLVVTKVREELVRDEALYEDSNTLIEKFNLFYVFDVTGETPVINGWEFIGRLEHDSVIGTVVRNAPAHSVPKKYWDAKCVCEHCNTSRMRKDTFILREVSTGKYKQIGRQCVRDFIGYENPADMHWWVSIMDSISDEVESYGCIRELPIVTVESVLKLAAACSQAYGYVSRKMSEESNQQSTTGTVGHLMFSRNLKKVESDVVSLAFSGKYDASVAEVLAWIKSWDAKTISQSEFNHNVHKFISGGYVRSNMMGYITCLPTMYAKAMGQLKAKIAKSNEFLGEVGSKISAQVKVANIVYLSGRFGTTSLVMMEDEKGNSVKWFASSNPDVQIGDSFVIKGTVKEHSNYKGINQTMLTRCKVV